MGSAMRRSTSGDSRYGEMELANDIKRGRAKQTILRIADDYDRLAVRARKRAVGTAPASTRDLQSMNERTVPWRVVVNSRTVAYQGFRWLRLLTSLRGIHQKMPPLSQPGHIERTAPRKKF